MMVRQCGQFRSGQRTRDQARKSICHDNALGIARANHERFNSGPRACYRRCGGPFV
jgi:hypothetical protein